MALPDTDLNMAQHIETDLHRAKGEGSAHSGTRHWWLMKISTIILIPLVLWFFFSLMCMVAGPKDYDTVLAWIKMPHHALLLCVLFGANFYHAELGGQEVIIDYVHHPVYQKWLLMLYKIFCAAAGLISIAAVFYIFFKM